MYGQFHNQLSQRNSLSATAPAFSEKKLNKKKALAILSLIFITLSLSVTSFAGSSQPRLKGGNGNAQGR